MNELTEQRDQQLADRSLLVVPMVGGCGVPYYASTNDD